MELAKVYRTQTSLGECTVDSQMEIYLLHCKHLELARIPSTHVQSSFRMCACWQILHVLFPHLFLTPELTPARNHKYNIYRKSSSNSSRGCIKYTKAQS